MGAGEEEGGREYITSGRHTLGGRDDSLVACVQSHKHLVTIRTAGLDQLSIEGRAEAGVLRGSEG